MMTYKKDTSFRLLLSSFLIAAALQLPAQKWIQMLDSAPNFYSVRDSFYQEWENKPYQRGKGYKQFKRWEWFMEPRSFPSGAFHNPAAAWSEMAAFNSASVNSQDKSAMPVGTWTPLGPNNWSNGSGWNAGNGRINVVVQDPVNTNTVYVGAASGGLWKSTDGGATWTNLTDNQPVLGVSGIAIDPNNTNTIYIGTGDGDGWNTYSVGVLKSTDAGATWATTGLNWSILPGRVVRKLQMDPNNASILFAATSDGLYKTSNAGVTWAQVAAISAEDVEIHPTNSNIVYTCSDQFFRSTDGGNTFTLVSSGLPSAASANRFKLAVSANQPEWVYVLAGDDGDATFLGLYRSTNAGLGFSTQTTTPNMFGYATDGSDDAGQSWYDMAIAVNPANASMVLIAGINVWKSTNAGTSFTCMTDWVFPNPLGYVHADVHDLAYFGSRVYSGSDGGIFKSENHGDDWTNLTQGITIMQFYDIAVSPQNGSLVIGGAQDNGTNRYTGTSTWTHMLGADGMDCIIDPTNANTMYGAIQFGSIQKSTNGGNSFNEIVSPNTFPGESGNWVTPYALDPANPSTIFVGYEEIYKSTNGGSTWSVLGSVGNATTTRNLEIAPSNSSVIYISKEHQLYRTTNGGTTWSNISAGLPFEFITDIAIDPANPDRVWVSVSGYSSGTKIFQSTNGGSTWANISGNLPNLPANCIAYQPNTNDVLFVGMDVGIYTKDATQANWASASTGLPNVIINEIEINAPLNKIVIGTYGRGAWEADITGGGGGGGLSNPSACELNLTIPDATCSTASNFAITVNSAPGNQMGSNVYLKEVKLVVSHNRVSDLDIQLVSPSGVNVGLSSGNGGSGDHYGNPSDTTCSQFTTFSMSAATPITAGTAPFIGSFIPEGDFADFDNGSSPIGNWTLRLCDVASIDTGTLQYVELVFASLIPNPSPCQMALVVPDASCGDANRFLVNVESAPGSQLGTDVFLREVKLLVAHTYTGDLGLRLRSPNGVTVDLSLNNGSFGDHYGDPADVTCASVTTFSMSASTPITAGTAPFIGTFIPQGDFADFEDGSDPVGRWTLELCDNFGGDEGQLRFVELVFSPLLANPSACGLGLPVPDLSCDNDNRFYVNVGSAPGTQLGTNVSLASAKVILSHTYTGDLALRLRSPNGVTVPLSLNRGGSGDNYGNPLDPTCTEATVFSMAAPNYISTGSAPFIGSYIPDGDFADFEDGSSPIGLWMLEICDDYFIDEGTLAFAELTFSGPPNCTALSSPANGATAVPANTTLTWAAATGAPTGYRLDIGTTPGGTDLLNNVDVGNVTTYDPPGYFPYGATVYVTVKPYNVNGPASGCTQQSFATAQCIPNLSIVSIPVPAGEHRSLGDLLSHTSTVANGTAVVFRSSTGVLLSHEFVVEAGGVFEVNIQVCGN